MRLLQKIKAKTDSITGYTWLGIVVLLALYMMLKTKRANVRRSRALKVVREPTLREQNDR